MLQNLIKKHASTSAAEPGRIVLKHLPYELNALEPLMSSETLDFHYGKHHRTYVNNLNTLLEKQEAALQRKDVRALNQISTDICFNGGGHLNHEIFWDSMCPQADSQMPSSGPLFDAIIHEYGSIEMMIQVFNKKSAGIKGSGWGWLVYNNV